MKCQSLLSGKIKIYLYINLSSVEFTHRVVKLKVDS